MAAYGELMSTKERFGTFAVQSDTFDVDLTNKIEDASDAVIMRLEEFPTVFPNPSTLTGSDKTRLDRIVADLAAAMYVEDRSQRARTGASQDFNTWAIVWRRRGMMELDQFIKVKTKASALGTIPDFKKIQGTRLGEKD